MNAAFAIDFEVEAPEGFDNVSAKEKNVIDVFYAGRFLGTHLAEFDPEKVRFLNTDKLVAAIPLVKNPDQLVALLKNEFHTNQDLLCGREPSPNCGQLETETAAVIFDYGNFKINLFLNPNLVEPFGKDAEKYIAPAEKKLSYLAAISGAVDKSRGEEVSDNYRLNQILAYGQKRLVSEFEYSSNYEQELQVENLLYEQDDQNLQYQLGFLETQSFSILPQQSFLGASIHTIRETRKDLDQASATPIVIFLRRNSQVSFFRGSRLISTQSFPPGSHVVKTKKFPRGAYQVRIVINETGGESREETRFFSKSLDLPLHDEVSYAISGGVLENPNVETGNFETTSKKVLNLKAASRLLPWFSFGLSSLVLEQGSYLSPESQFSVGPLLFNQDFLISTRDDLGAGVRIDYIGEDSFYFNTSASRIWAGNNQIIGDFRDVLSANLEDQTQLSAQLGLSYFKTKTSLRYNFQENNLKQKIYSVSLRTETPFRQRSWGSPFFSTETTYTQTDLQFLLNLTINFTGPKNTFARTRLGARIEREPDLEIGEKRIEPSFSAVAGKRFGEVGDRLDTLVSGRKDSRFESYQARADYEGSYGNLESFYNLATKPDSDNSFGSEFLFSLAANDEGASIGGERANRSAVVVKVGGEYGQEFDVLVNGEKRGVIKTGTQILFPLSPYEEYRIKLAARKDNLSQYDAGEKRVTLYPGNVKTLRWEPKQIYVLITKIVDKDGEPLSAAVTEDLAEPAETDLSGWFQAEIEYRTKLIKFLTDKGSECEVEIPRPDGGSDTQVVTLEELSCI